MTGAFTRVAALGELPPGRMKRVEVGGRDVALINVGGQIFALDNRCPHQGGPLALGQLDDEVITCPWHGWRWNARTGRAVWPPVDWRVPRYQVQVDGDDILVAER